MRGQSIWRGKFNRTTDKVILDVAAKTGDVDVTVDASSINFGMAAQDEIAKVAEIFDRAKLPIAAYKGKIRKWNGKVPVEVDGQFTLKGITNSLKLTIHSFLCKR